MSDEPNKQSSPAVESRCYARVLARGNVNGLAVIDGYRTMDVGRALDLIHRTYSALHRGQWQDGETETELCDSINDYMTDMFGPNWSF